VAELKKASTLSTISGIICAFALPYLMRGNDYFLHIYIICIINVILANSLRAIATTGQMSLGQAGFMAVGAYTSAILGAHFHIPALGGLLLGGVAAAALGAVVGYPLSRVKTVYFVMVTMFLGEVVRLAIYEWSNITGGSTGMIGIPGFGAYNIFGWFEVDFIDRMQFCYLALILLSATLAILFNLTKSPIGIILGAIGQEEAVVQSVGINVAGYKVMILCVGSFFTGMAGSLYAHYMTVLTPDNFGIFTSIYIMIYVIVGGTKSVAGATLGAVILTIVPELSASLDEYQPFVFVLVLFLVIFLLPGGIVELVDKLKSGWHEKIQLRRGQ
jgi:branched-chain amino acid transport system permease protein